jgi:hypothetical protein
MITILGTLPNITENVNIGWMPDGNLRLETSTLSPETLEEPKEILKSSKGYSYLKQLGKGKQCI